MKKTALVVMSLFVLALAGCAPTAPQVDIAAEKDAIKKMLAMWLEVTNKPFKEGADEYVSYATEDAVWLPPNAEQINGRADIRAWVLLPTQNEDSSVDWKTTSIEVAADGKLAYAIGTYDLSLKDAAGNPFSDKGKWVNIYKKQTDGSWQCSAAIWNSDLPAPGA